eukprot:scaffold25013_cov122-Cylindrotheca_fusiformis.AAC.1
MLGGGTTKTREESERVVAESMTERFDGARFQAGENEVREQEKRESPNSPSTTPRQAEAAVISTATNPYCAVAVLRRTLTHVRKILRDIPSQTF